MNDQEFRTEIAATLDRYRRMFPEECEGIEALERLTAAAADLRSRKTFPGHVTASGLLVRPADGAILLVRHKALGAWLQPGGHLEPTETAAEAAAREAAEETGLRRLTLHPWHRRHGVPIDIDAHTIPAAPRKREPEHRHFDFRYVFVVPSGTAIRLHEGEVEGYRWVPIPELASVAAAPALCRAAAKAERLLLG